MAKFKNVSDNTVEIEGYVVGPDDVVTLDPSNPDTQEELRILLEVGEFVGYAEEGESLPAIPVGPEKVFFTQQLPEVLEKNAVYYVAQADGKHTTIVTDLNGNPTQQRRRWNEYEPGRRAYLYFSTVWDRGPHLLYPTYIHQASAYSQTNPSRDAHGVGVNEKARIKSITQELRGAATEQTPYTITLWKQKKSSDSNTVVNTKLFSKNYTLPGTTNVVHKWGPEDLETDIIEADEILFFVYRRTVSGTNRFAYVKYTNYEFEAFG